jgi:multiple sugar transport system substrate-binding protein
VTSVSEVVLRALGWDNPRCTLPMEAAAREWKRRTGVDVRWSYRPLSSFNDAPLQEVMAGYDIVVLDHPLVPDAAERGLLVALDDRIAGETLAEIAADALGASHESYRWAGLQWALAVDAACHVACGRPDLLEALGIAAPATWDAVIALAERAPGAVAVPLTAADSACALVSLAATVGDPLRAGRPVSRRAVHTLCEVAARVDRSCFSTAPPQLLQEMTRTGSVAFAPLTFGYSSFAQAGGRTDTVDMPLHFSDVPGTAEGSEGGVVSDRGRGVLGGAGLAIPSTSSHVDAAAEFAGWVCSPATQRDIVLRAGGQPASRSAWLAARSDTGNPFFDDVLSAIDAAVLRPLDPAWPRIQQRLGETLRDGLRIRAPADRIADSLDEIVTTSAAVRVTA